MTWDRKTTYNKLWNTGEDFWPYQSEQALPLKNIVCSLVFIKCRFQILVKKTPSTYKDCCGMIICGPLRQSCNCNLPTILQWRTRIRQGNILWVVPGIKEISHPVSIYFHVTGILSDSCLHWYSCPSAVEAAIMSPEGLCLLRGHYQSYCGVNNDNETVTEWFFVSQLQLHMLSFSYNKIL